MSEKRIVIFDQRPQRLITTAMKRSLSIPAITRHFFADCGTKFEIKHFMGVQFSGR
ncbi:hypothetical protein O9X81_21515 [Agrobacterium salinitolerans]|uniref:hypothetical protein n=1 Tax=Agrobacterium salinitolerans TaxID=1183413 RepID=UPI0022B856DB|nr:hypothetical protein [Agrobacterium salinitolerans]MCZ7859186.1 hypothetical protein [Agrobacterium salinitolerans]